MRGPVLLHAGEGAPLDRYTMILEVMMYAVLQWQHAGDSGGEPMAEGELMARKFSILGDSISTFAGFNPPGYRVFYEKARCGATGVLAAEDTWWKQAIDRLGGILLANASYSGSLVEGSGFPAGSSSERISALSRDGELPDDVIVLMGINDYGWGGAAAEAAAGGFGGARRSGPGATGGDVGAAPADAIERFEAAYDLMLARLHEAYPHAEAWCCTLCPGRVAGRRGSTFAYRLRGIHLDGYNDAIARAAGRRGCRVADVRALNCDYEAVDGTHPTALGMRQLAAMVVRAMDAAAPPQRGAAASGGAVLPSTGPRPRRACAPIERADEFRSSERCDEPNCIGCPHAASTGSAWQLVCGREGAAPVAAEAPPAAAACDPAATVGGEAVPGAPAADGRSAYGPASEEAIVDAEPPLAAARRPRALFDAARILGENIVAERRRRGLSREELAERIGMGVDELACIEEGRCDPQVLSTVARIARGLQADLPVLLRGM